MNPSSQEGDALRADAEGGLSVNLLAAYAASVVEDVQEHGFCLGETRHFMHSGKLSLSSVKSGG